MIAHSCITSGSGSEEQCAAAEGAALSALVSLAGFFHHCQRRRWIPPVPPVAPCAAPSELGGLL
jgi:hypothetical protein